jgi:hypothetical protein
MSDTTRLVSPDGTWRVRLQGVLTGRPSDMHLATATPATNGGKWRYPAALCEFRRPSLNGAQRSVNRKDQGSNPWSGAKFTFEIESVRLLEMMTSRSALHLLSGFLGNSA